MSEQAIQLTINGKAVSVPAQYGDWTLVRYLRQVAGLTGTKQSCDNEGTCGSCTVIINGQARRSCREKLSALQGSQIETVESLGEMPDGIPHPLIQTVIQDGVFQCGYCSSGALMAAKALLDKNANPSVDEIKRTLSSIICRCSGLNRMEQSVQRAAAVLRGEASTGWTVEDTENEYRAINKLTGRLQYTDDLSFPDMLYGVALRSPLPHARVLKVDVSKAGQMPGVVRVLTAKDVPGRNRYGLLVRDQPIFCDEVVRFVGDALALVVAETQDQARAALPAIEVELDPLPVISNPEQALRPDAPVLHEYLRQQNPGEAPNVLAHRAVRKGNIDEGFAEAEVILEGDYRVPFIDHAYMELECSIGVPEENGGMTVYCGSQGPTFDQEQVAEALGVDKAQVRIAHMYVGGGFGGKEDVTGQVQAAVAAAVTGRPVKVLFTREESLRAHHKRHAETMHYKVGATRDGRLVAAEVEILGDTGAYASTGEAVLMRSSTFACGPYVIPHVKVDTYAVHTNNPTCGAFRGFGGTQVAFSSEVHLQKLIDALGMDPFEFRLKNAIDLGKATVTGHVLTEEVGTGYVACLEAVRQELAKTERPALEPGERLGIGVAGAYKNVGLGSGIPDGAGATISLEEDGSLLVRHGASDIGQGAEDVVAIVTSRTLNVPQKMIKIHTGDTRFDPLGGMTTASRATFVTGNATLQAARQLKEQLLEAVASEFSVAVEELEMEDGAFVNRSTGQRYLTLKELAGSGERYAATANYDAPYTNPVPPKSEAWPTTQTSDHRLHFAYCYGVQAAMVAVNPETGKVRVLKIIAAHDVGKALSRKNCVGQIEGATVQGLGYALSEQYAVKDGFPQTTHFRDLGLQRIDNLPEITSILVEQPHPFGPYGAKGMGELAISPTAPAVANAIHDAVGVWVDELPITTEKLLAAIRAQK